MAEFNKFVNSNEDIFFQYNKKFSLPKCSKSKKNCSCFEFARKRSIDFSFEYPMSAIYFLKSYIRKTLIETEKHNNLSIIRLYKSANFTRRKTVKNSIKDHEKTLKIFQKYFEQKTKKPKHFLRYIIYIDNQISKCQELLNETVPWQYDELIPIIILKTSLYAHYHTLKMFENFVK